MKVINTNKEKVRDSMLESHNEVLKQCEQIENLYAVIITIHHNRAMEYSFEIKDLYSDLVLLKYSKNIPGKAKNYLKGLIDAHKIQIK